MEPESEEPEWLHDDDYVEDSGEEYDPEYDSNGEEEGYREPIRPKKVIKDNSTQNELKMSFLLDIRVKLDAYERGDTYIPELSEGLFEMIEDPEWMEQVSNINLQISQVLDTMKSKGLAFFYKIAQFHRMLDDLEPIQEYRIREPDHDTFQNMTLDEKFEFFLHDEQTDIANLEARLGIPTKAGIPYEVIQQYLVGTVEDINPTGYKNISIKDSMIDKVVEYYKKLIKDSNPNAEYHYTILRLIKRQLYLDEYMLQKQLVDSIDESVVKKPSRSQRLFTFMRALLLQHPQLKSQLIAFIMSSSNFSESTITKRGYLLEEWEDYIATVSIDQNAYDTKVSDVMFIIENYPEYSENKTIYDLVYFSAEIIKTAEKTIVKPSIRQRQQVISKLIQKRFTNANVLEKAVYAIAETTADYNEKMMKVFKTNNNAMRVKDLKRLFNPKPVEENMDTLKLDINEIDESLKRKRGVYYNLIKEAFTPDTKMPKMKIKKFLKKRKTVVPPVEIPSGSALKRFAPSLELRPVQNKPTRRPQFIIPKRRAPLLQISRIPLQQSTIEINESLAEKHRLKKRLLELENNSATTNSKKIKEESWDHGDLMKNESMTTKGVFIPIGSAIDSVDLENKELVDERLQKIDKRLKRYPKRSATELGDLLLEKRYLEGRIPEVPAYTAPTIKVPPLITKQATSNIRYIVFNERKPIFRGNSVYYIHAFGKDSEGMLYRVYDFDKDPMTNMPSMEAGFTLEIENGRESWKEVLTERPGNYPFIRVPIYRDPASMKKVTEYTWMLIPRIYRNHIRYIAYGHIYDACNRRSRKNCGKSIGMRGAVCLWNENEPDFSKKCAADYTKLATNERQTNSNKRYHRYFVDNVKYNSKGEVISHGENKILIPYKRYQP
jgi:CHASE3 domain sensor protein